MQENVNFMGLNPLILFHFYGNLEYLEEHTTHQYQAGLGHQHLVIKGIIVTWSLVEW